MEKKEKVYGVQAIVDLKPTQIELLKVLKKLDYNLESNNLEGKRECINKSYADIFSELDPLVKYIDQLKKNKYVEVENNFLSGADLVTRIINDMTDEPLVIKYSNKVNITPPIRLRNITFDDSSLNTDIITQGTSSIKKNNGNTLTINFKDGSLDDEILKQGNSSIKKNNSNTLTINLKDGSLDDGILKQGNASIQQNNGNTLKVNLTNQVLLDTSVIERTNKQLEQEKGLKTPTFKTDPYFNSNAEEKSQQLDDDMKVVEDYVASRKDLLNDETEDLTEFGNEMVELDEALTIINKLIETISTVLNPNKIQSIVKEQVKIIATSTIILQKTMKFNSKEIELKLPEIVKIFDIDKAKINDIDIDLDNDPVLELKGGNLEAYFRKLFVPKQNMGLQIRAKLSKLKNEINRFNVLFIQYNYYLNFIINKIKSLQILETYDIKLFLSLKDIDDILVILEKKYKIITNPQDIFKADINSAEKKKLKILYFKHYYFIYMLYNFFNNIKNKASRKGNSMSEDFAVNIIDEKIVSGDKKIDLIKYFTIFNLYSDLIKD